MRKLSTPPPPRLRPPPAAPLAVATSGVTVPPLPLPPWVLRSCHGCRCHAIGVVFMAWLAFYVVGVAVASNISSWHRGCFHRLRNGYRLRLSWTRRFDFHREGRLWRRASSTGRLPRRLWQPTGDRLATLRFCLRRVLRWGYFSLQSTFSVVLGPNYL